MWMVSHYHYHYCYDYYHYYHHHYHYYHYHYYHSTIHHSTTPPLTLQESLPSSVALGGFGTCPLGRS